MSLHPAHSAVLSKIDAPHPVSVLHAATAATGTKEWLMWAPETVQRALKASGASDAAIRSALAVQTVATREGFWNNYHQHHLLAQALCGLPFHTGQMDELPLRVLYLAVDGAIEVRHALGISIPVFSDEVAAYVAAQALRNQIWLLLDVLAFAQPHATKRRYHCTVCGSDGPVWVEDGYCDVCSKRFTTEHLNEPLPSAEAVHAQQKSARYYSLNDPNIVIDALRELAEKPDGHLPDGPGGRCALRLLDVLEWLEDRRDWAIRSAWWATKPVAGAQASKKEAGVGRWVTDAFRRTATSGREAAKDWWKTEAPVLRNMFTDPAQALRSGYNAVTAPVQGLGLDKYVGKTVDKGLDVGLRGLGVVGSVSQAVDDARAVDPHTGERRGIAERALSSAGGAYASVAGWPLGIIAGTATGLGGSFGGAALGRVIDRGLGTGPQRLHPMPPPVPHPQTPPLPHPVPQPVPQPVPHTFQVQHPAPPTPQPPVPEPMHTQDPQETVQPQSYNTTRQLSGTTASLTPSWRR